MKISEHLGAIFEPPDTAETTHIGDLGLAPHQSRAVAALTDCVRKFGGALLADSVGLGKTRVCLAAASSLHAVARAEDRRGPIWLVVPARLGQQWTDRCQRAGLRADQFVVVTHAAMSRGQVPAADPSVIVVDEAHRFRNPSARRYRVLAGVAGGVPLLLATATPVANGRQDLLALLRLFLGDADLRPWLGVDLTEAFDRGGAELFRVLERLVVRRSRWDGDSARRPRTRLELLEYEPGPAEAWVWANLGDVLASHPLTLLESDWPRPLFVEHALRLWESGPQALAQLLDGLVAFHERWLEANAHGESLDRSGFRELFGSRPDQSVLPFMFGEASADTELSASRTQVTADLEALVQLQRRVASASADVARERAILELMRRAPGKLLVFTSFRNAARSLFDAMVEGLGPEARVGLVTGDDSRATGLGRTTAGQILRRFSPGGQPLPPHQRLDVLVATDCIAEGVDLQDCGRVVLADLPYSPLRVEQRIGRLLRPGSPHDEVIVHLPRPRNWNDSLGMRRRLKSKMGDAADVGTPFTAISGSDDAQPLAVLTRRDAWMRQLPRPATEAAERVHLTSQGEDAVWVIARLDDGDSAEHVVVRVGANGAVETRWGRLLSAFDELARGTPTVASGVQRQHLVAIGEAEVQAQVERMNASRMAPFAIALDSAVHRAFASISDWALRESFSIDVDHLRQVLLRPWPPGIERRIEGWVEAPWRGARDYVNLPSHPATTRVEVAQLFAIDAQPCITRGIGGFSDA